MMQIRVKLFAGLRQVAGWSNKEIELPDQATVGSALEYLNKLHPALNLDERTFYAAVNQEFAQREDPLADGDEVALLPPMSGGNGDEPNNRPCGQMIRRCGTTIGDSISPRTASLCTSMDS